MILKKSQKLFIRIYFTFSKVKAGTADCKQNRQTDSSKTKRCTEFDSTVAISQTFIHTSSIFQMTLDSRTTYFYTPKFSRNFSSIFLQFFRRIFFHASRTCKFWLNSEGKLWFLYHLSFFHTSAFSRNFSCK